MGMKNGGVIFIPLGVPQAHGELLHKCRAIWQIARTIYQIVLQIFIPFGERPLMGNSYENKFRVSSSEFRVPLSSYEFLISFPRQA